MILEPLNDEFSKMGWKYSTYLLYFGSSAALNLRRLETRIGISCATPGLAGHLLGQFT